MGETLWDYVNVLIFLKISPINFGTYLWVLITAIIIWLEWWLLFSSFLLHLEEINYNFLLRNSPHVNFFQVWYSLGKCRNHEGAVRWLSQSVYCWCHHRWDQETEHTGILEPSSCPLPVTTLSHSKGHHYLDSNLIDDFCLFLNLI